MSLESTHEAVLKAIEHRPGADATGIARDLALSPSSVEYHLRRLADERRIFRVRVGRVVACYAAGSGHCPFLRRAIPLVANATAAEEALRALRAAGPDGVRPTEAARASGASVHAMRWAFVAAEEAGVAERAQWGRYRLAPGARACAERIVERAPCAAGGRCVAAAAALTRSSGRRACRAPREGREREGGEGRNSLPSLARGQQ